eukprot:sb/3471358/
MLQRNLYQKWTVAERHCNRRSAPRHRTDLLCLLSRIDTIPLNYFFASSIKSSLTDQYDLGDTTSSGPISVVHGACCINTSRKYVVKKIKKSNYLQGNDLEEAEEMARTIARIRHSNICPVTDIYEDKDCLYVVMEKVEGGELFSRLADVENYSEFHAAAIIRDVLIALQYLHGQDIVHANIKVQR